MAIFGDFLHPVFSASSEQHVSNLHLKFAARPHHVQKSMADIQYATAEIRQRKKDRRWKTEDRRRNHRATIGRP